MFGGLIKTSKSAISIASIDSLSPQFNIVLASTHSAIINKEFTSIVCFAVIKYEGCWIMLLRDLKIGVYRVLKFNEPGLLSEEVIASNTLLYVLRTL